MTLIKIGHNPATNMLPMFFYLDKETSLYNLAEGYPAQHNQWLADGIIHMAPISSFSFGEHWDKYLALPDLSVSAPGNVGSISLFSKLDLKELDGKTIALTNHSATSVNLLKVILEHFYKIKPIYKTMPPHHHKMLLEADAALLIGDEAIKADFDLKYPRHDLGELWYQFTGYSMTYALWAVPQKFALDNKQITTKMHQLLLQSKEKGLNNIKVLIDYCYRMVGYTRSFWESYFSNLNYCLTEKELQGLNYYYKLCVEHGLLNSIPEIKLCIS